MHVGTIQSASTYKPVQFFLITFLGSWTSGFLAAYLSYQEGMGSILTLLGIACLGTPLVTTLAMIYGSKNKELRVDFVNRLRLDKIQLQFLPVMLLLMPIVVLLATGLSLFFGKSADQFALSSQLNIMPAHLLASLLILFLAPTIEELSWRGYGVDSLRSRFNLFNTSIIFATLWSLWHLPLFFVKGYYHNELWNTSIIYAANFFVSIMPVALLINWVYYKNNRSIIAAILFHFMINLFSMLFQTEQFTKCIITVLLLLVSAIIVIRDRKFFFERL